MKKALENRKVLTGLASMAAVAFVVTRKSFKTIVVDSFVEGFNKGLAGQKVS